MRPISFGTKQTIREFTSFGTAVVHVSNVCARAIRLHCIVDLFEQKLNAQPQCIDADIHVYTCRHTQVYSIIVVWQLCVKALKAMGDVVNVIS